MATTYEPIATTTLASAANAITFSSIPATYTDLRLVFVGIRATTTNSAPIVRFNSDSATNYNMTAIYGNGTSAVSYIENNAIGIPLVYFDALVDTTPKLGTLDIFSYTNSKNKTALNMEASDRNGSGRIVNAVGVWRSTSVITSLTITDGSARNMGVGTTATLYGIKSA